MERSLALDPAVSDDHLALIRLLGELGEWSRALTVAKRWTEAIRRSRRPGTSARSELLRQDTRRSDDAYWRRNTRRSCNDAGASRGALTGLGGV
jgi:hypothetical protein